MMQFCLPTYILPSDSTNRVVEELVAKISTPKEINAVIGAYVKQNPNNKKLIDTKTEQLVDSLSIKFGVDQLLAALFLDTSKSNQWFRTKLSSLQTQEKMNKINTLLKQLTVFTENNSLFKKVLKTLYSVGARLKPLNSVSVDGIVYSFTFEDGTTEILKNQNEQKTVVDRIYAGEPRCLGIIGNNMIALANNVLSNDSFEINVFHIDIEKLGIMDEKTFSYKGNTNNMLDAVCLSRSFVKDRYVLVAAPMKKNKDGEFAIEYDKVSSYSFFIIDSNAGSLIKRFDIAL